MAIVGFFNKVKVMELAMSKVETQNSARDVTSRAERLIETEIWCNDSSFVSELMKETSQDQFGFDQIVNLFDESLSAIEEFFGDEGVLPSNWAQLDEEVKRKAADECGFSPLLKDILEWWRVSEPLARHLIRIEEPVLKNDFGSWWGRTCSGQSILMDGTIQRILSGAGGSHG